MAFLSHARLAATRRSTNRATVIDAKTVPKEGFPEEIVAVKAGEAAVSTIAD